ncbi:unnamed protein product, partial [Medioppia subpectinata]
MYSFRAVLTKCGVRTPLMVTVSLIGSTHWLQHRRRSHWPSESLPFAQSMAPFGLRSVYLWSSSSSSGSGADRRDSGFGGAGPESATSSPPKPKPSPPTGSPPKGATGGSTQPSRSASPNTGPDLTVEKICEESFEAIVSVRQMLTHTEHKEKKRVHNTSSGFIVDEHFILTSARAVGNASQVEVKLKGSATTTTGPVEGICVVVYKEPELDLALLTPLSKTSKQLGFADVTGDYPWYADKVVALGSSWNYNTVTNGIVSCPKRTGAQITKIGKKYGFISTPVEYIQHTASFAFDDYGGALLDMKGKVVGMYFYLQLIDNIVLYFAVPSNKILPFVAEGIKRYKKTPELFQVEGQQGSPKTAPKTAPKVVETPAEKEEREKREKEAKERRSRRDRERKKEKKSREWEKKAPEREEEKRKKEEEERRRKEEEERKRQESPAERKKKAEEALKKRLKELEEERKKKPRPKKQPQKRDPRSPP